MEDLMITHKKIIGGLAVFGLLATPTLASAGTRAGDSAVRVAPVAQSVATEANRAGVKVDKKNNLTGSGLVIAIIAGLAVIGGVIAAASDDDGSNGA